MPWFSTRKLGGVGLALLALVLVSLSVPLVHAQTCDWTGTYDTTLDGSTTLYPATFIQTGTQLIGIVFVGPTSVQFAATIVGNGATGTYQSGVLGLSSGAIALTIAPDCTTIQGTLTSNLGTPIAFNATRVSSPTPTPTSTATATPTVPSTAPSTPTPTALVSPTSTVTPSLTPSTTATSPAIASSTSTPPVTPTTVPPTSTATLVSTATGTATPAPVLSPTPTAMASPVLTATVTPSPVVPELPPLALFGSGLLLLGGLAYRSRRRR